MLRSNQSFLSNHPHWNYEESIHLQLQSKMPLLQNQAQLWRALCASSEYPKRTLEQYVLTVHSCAELHGTKRNTLYHQQKCPEYAHEVHKQLSSQHLLKNRKGVLDSNQNNSINISSMLPLFQLSRLRDLRIQLTS